MLASLTEGIWTRDAPLSMLGLQIGTRMSVIRLPSGDLAVHSPIRIDDSTKAEIDALGPVRHVIAPNAFHHLFVGDFVAHYPDARVYAPRKLKTKRADLRIDVELESCEGEWEGAFEAIPIPGTLLHETALIHTPTRTLISPDILENFETSPHWFTRWYLKAFGIHGKAAVGLPLRVFYRDRKAARGAMDAILEHEIDRIVLAHGDLVTEDAKSTLREAYTWLR